MASFSSLSTFTVFWRIKKETTALTLTAKSFFLICVVLNERLILCWKRQSRSVAEKALKTFVPGLAAQRCYHSYQKLMMDQLYLDLAGAMINNITLSIIEPLKTTARTIRWEKA